MPQNTDSRDNAFSNCSIVDGLAADAPAVCFMAHCVLDGDGDELGFLRTLHHKISRQVTRAKAIKFKTKLTIKMG